MVQAKLRVGAVDDPLEREADRAADAVMGGAGAGALTPAIIPAAQRKCAACEAEDEAPIQRKCAACGRESAMAPARAETAAAAVSHRGAPLSRDLRAYFEPRFGRDLSDVRVHTHPTGAEAARGIGAKAYTLGPDIAFATGEYAPGTSAGRHLIAHELAHVGQQTQATIRRAPQDTGAADAPPATANPATAGAEATPDKQFQAYDKMFKDGGKGRWYKIASVGLDPEKQKKLGP